jgi:phage gp36-like protein
MSYATLAMLTDRYGLRMLADLTDRGEVATGAVDTDVVDRALADADAVIDGYLAGRYTLPLATVPPLVADIAASIAIWRLHPSAADPKIEADYREALRMLRDIADGRVRIPAGGVEPVATGGSGARMTDRARPMTERTLKGFI